MTIRFLHCADIHLGYQQYNRNERFNDFNRAFIAVIDAAIAARVDFVLLAGDLFQKRSIDALTLNQAMRGLERLRAAHIPVIAVEGNHERSYYDETIGWMKFLALQGLLLLLDAEFVDGKPLLRDWDTRRRQGSYLEPVQGVRVHGMRYYGSGTGRAIQAYAEAVAALPADGVNFTIFVAHAGVEGQMDDSAGGLSGRQWSVLRPYVDYLALGHFHKPFQVDGWIYNPGSPENCSVAEAAWPERGYLLVEIEPGSDRERPAVRVQQGVTPRRAVRVYPFRVDAAARPEDLMNGLRSLLLRKAAELNSVLNSALNSALTGAQNSPDAVEFGPPIVEVYLSGVLAFNRSELDLHAVEALVQEVFQPLVALVKDLTQGAALVVDVDEALPRAELERRVLAGLFGRDARYSDLAEDWAALAVTVKQLVLADGSPEALLDELAAGLDRLAQPMNQPERQQES